jgi:hypothetical protein
MLDINQGSVGDCYFLATLQSLAYEQPAKLQEYAVDLGDGTYAVEFNRGGNNPTYLRVDGDFAGGGWGGVAYAHPQWGGGAIWATVFEKAYAFYRYGQNTYSSLNYGWTGAVFYDLGVPVTSFYSGTSNLFNVLTTALANHKAVAAITNTSISNAPIIGSHAYSVVATSVESGVQYVTVRNPWGVDGAGSDSNTQDGLVKITLAQFVTCFSSGSIQT